MKDQNEKQAIEEMAKDLYHKTTAYNTCWEEDCEDLANILYNEGYRRQIEGAFILFKPRRENRNATYRCSVCGKLCSSYYNDVGAWKYCPNCGAHMKRDDKK